MAEPEELGRLINERRLALGFSLGQLANRVGATAAEVRGWEKAGATPPDDALPKLGSVLGVAPERLASAKRTAPAPPTSMPRDTAATAPPRQRPAPTERRQPPPGAPAPAQPPGDDPTSMIGATSPPDSDATRPPGAVTGAGAVGMVFSDDSATGDSPVETAPTPAATPQAPEPAPVPVVADDDAPIEHAPIEPDPMEPARPEQDRIEDLPTEAVAVVGAGGGARSPQAASLPTAPPPAAPTTRQEPRAWPDSTPDTTKRQGIFGPFNDFVSTILDPERRYLFWIRIVLTVIVLLVFARVLLAVVPDFFDTLKEILDTIESTTDSTIPGDITVTTLPSG